MKQHPYHWSVELLLLGFPSEIVQSTSKNDLANVFLPFSIITLQTLAFLGMFLLSCLFFVLVMLMNPRAPYGAQ